MRAAALRPWVESAAPRAILWGWGVGGCRHAAQAGSRCEKDKVCRLRPACSDSPSRPSCAIPEARSESLREMRTRVTQSPDSLSFQKKPKTNFTVYVRMIFRGLPAHVKFALLTPPHPSRPPALTWGRKKMVVLMPCRVLQPSTDREAIFTHVKPHTKPRSCHRSPSVHLQGDRGRRAAA